MTKCKICSKNCQCGASYCDSCVEDLSEDETRVAIVKQKAIIKNKKRSGKGKISQFEDEQKASQLLKKKIREVFFEDTHNFTQTDLSFYSYLMESKNLKLAEMNYLAGFRHSMKMNEYNSRLLFDFNQRQLLEIYFFVENSIEIFLFFNVKSLPQMYHSDELTLNQQPIIKTNTLVNLGGNIKHESKHEKSYFIFKNEVRKRCLTEVYNHKKGKMEVTSLYFAQQYVQLLSRQDLKRIHRGVSEKSNSEDNGIVIRSLTIGKILLSQHVEKIVISREEYKGSLDTIVEKLRKKGISVEIERPSSLQSDIE